MITNIIQCFSSTQIRGFSSINFTQSSPKCHKSFRKQEVVLCMQLSRIHLITQKSDTLKFTITESRNRKTNSIQIIHKISKLLLHNFQVHSATYSNKTSHPLPPFNETDSISAVFLRFLRSLEQSAHSHAASSSLFRITSSE